MGNGQNLDQLAFTADKAESILRAARGPFPNDFIEIHRWDRVRATMGPTHFVLP